MKKHVRASALTAPVKERGFGLADGRPRQDGDGRDERHTTEIGHGAVVIAAITSCTNTSQPVGDARRRPAGQEGRRDGPARCRRYVKTSLAPGSTRRHRLLRARPASLPYLEKLGFNTVGYGCTTCIGNSGPLPDAVAKAVTDGNLVVAAVLSGNRNFEGRINPHVKANYLASPPLVVAYALAGTTDIDLTNEPLGTGNDGKPVYLQRHLADAAGSRRTLVEACITPEMFASTLRRRLRRQREWNAIKVAERRPVRVGRETRTYIQEPPFFHDLTLEPRPSSRHHERARARAARRLGHDRPHLARRLHRKDSPAGKYLMRTASQPPTSTATAAPRQRPRDDPRHVRQHPPQEPPASPAPKAASPSTCPTGEVDVDLRRRDELPGRRARRWSSSPARNTARAPPATGPPRARCCSACARCIAESFERIHRSNLVGMGVLPLQFKEGENAETLGLTGKETLTIVGVPATGRRARTSPSTWSAPDGSRTASWPSPASTPRSRSTTTGTAASCRRCCGRC